MVNLEEIIERSFYIALLHETLKRGLTINPDDYLVDGLPTESTADQFEQDKKAICRNMLTNPFEKFERKRFLYYSVFDRNKIKEKIFKK